MTDVLVREGAPFPRVFVRLLLARCTKGLGAC